MEAANDDGIRLTGCDDIRRLASASNVVIFSARPKIKIWCKDLLSTCSAIPAPA
jgi:hypothetical protein